MSSQIVVLNVTQTVAPAPSNQQQLGAFVSQGGTTLAANSKQLLLGVGDLAAILKAPLALTTLAWAASVVTATTAAPHGVTNGQTFQVTIAGAAPAGYNGTFTATSTGASTFTYPLVANPGAETLPGTYVPADAAQLNAMNTTFWAQGSNAPVYVLELGLAGTASGVTALGTYITNNTVNGLGPFYAYLVPREWAAEATFPAFVANYIALDKKTYFHITAADSTYAAFGTSKSAVVSIEAAGIAATEFDAASAFWDFIANKPSATSKISPFNFRYALGTTAFGQTGAGVAATIDTYLAAGVNLILTGAEGGIANTVLRNGTTKDGRDMMYWYAVDWTQINLARDIAAAIINGSNNALNPLYYNQQGINTLQAVASNAINRGVTFGAIFGPPKQVQMDPSDFVLAVENGDFVGYTPINCQGFIPYVQANASDYAAGIYNGMQIAMTPNRGFKQIVIGLNITDFVAGVG